jgi:hypothetical protein
MTEAHFLVGEQDDRGWWFERRSWCFDMGGPARSRVFDASMAPTNTTVHDRILICGGADDLRIQGFLEERPR